MNAAKTSWSADDYFNVSDYARITENLNAAATLLRCPTKAYPQAGLDTYRLLDIFLAIADEYNRLRVIAGLQSNYPVIIVENRTVWFTYEELNAIEGLCVAVVHRILSMASYGNGFAYGNGNVYGGGKHG